jgi:hypothetical protein
MLREIVKLGQDDLQYRASQTMEYLRKLSTDPRFIGKDGSISNDGKAAIRRGYLLFKALEVRLQPRQ